MAISINYDLDQGTDFSFIATRKDSDGFPVAITGGATAYSQMRKFYSSSSAVTFNTTVTGVTGEVLVSLAATGTSGIKGGVYFYDVELHITPKDGSNNAVGSTKVSRIVQGMITVYPEVTKI
jgi:hypothetical protein